MSAPRDSVLAIRDLRVVAPNGAVLVDGISLDLPRGEILGLIGESGAGKSTIGLAAMGYGRGGCRIAGGRIELAGTELTASSRPVREAMRGARIAYVAQSAAAAFDPAMRLDRQILETPLQHGLMSAAEARDWMVELFRALQLPDPEGFGRRYPHQVSGGQLQRAMMAMAMSGKPDVLVLDEPTTALDVTTQVEVLALLRDTIRRYGTSALYITHDLAVVAQLADRLMVLRHGREVESGTTAEVLESPREDYTRRLVAERRESLAPAAGVRHDAGETVLDLRNVDAGYGGSLVLQDVSLSVRRGETLAVVGESGSGKSTLARLVAGLLPPARGVVDFRGRPLPGSYRDRDLAGLKSIQMIYQLPDVALNPRQTVGEAIGRPLAFYRGLRGAARREEVARLLALIGLPGDFADRLPGALSGGQNQRVCIARALAAEPDLLICDEVTSALDPLIAEDILRLLRRLQDELGMTYLFITHDLSVVRRLADRTVVMQKGRIVEEGPTATLFETPRAAYTRTLLDSVPELRRDWLDGVLARRVR
ncbi:Alpha-glucoside transport ATP-binding protein AglK [Rubellimicrobium mesophilum DSM 19309]|uniref:Alpha-glucoside transport ATP-binding protein AglK n=1 Tax=Rubellimicrobium mesophilum DSM 19309 TaxID=442562 RepID=A0A017HQT1_9RHOB|nr:ABC transporter ATP-binding protein [Rubellimicrobium mesophilum]EYD76675.1 Alpha-glucoside transport ATP-binding protein AglK [Rubellimicrobium mesophilum DSM 19309]